MAGTFQRSKPAYFDDELLFDSAEFTHTSKGWVYRTNMNVSEVLMSVKTSSHCA